MFFIYQLECRSGRFLHNYYYTLFICIFRGHTHNDTGRESRCRAHTYKQNLWPYAVNTFKFRFYILNSGFSHMNVSECETSTNRNVRSHRAAYTMPWHSEIFDQQSHTLTNTYAGCSATLFFNYFIYKKTISHEFNNGAIQAHKLNALNECSQFSKYPVLFPSLCRILAYSLFRDVIHVDILCMVCV